MKTTEDFNEFRAKSNDRIDWRTIGANNQNITSNKTRKTKNKHDFNIIQPQKCCLKTQGPLVVSWPGNFFDPDSADGIVRVLYTNGNGGPIKIGFVGYHIRGVGVQIQEHYGINPGTVGTPFRATLTCFNGATVVASTPPHTGISDQGATQAIFIGAYDDTVANIDSVEIQTFPINSGDNGEFAIGTVYLIV